MLARPNDMHSPQCVQTSCMGHNLVGATYDGGLWIFAYPVGAKTYHLTQKTKKCVSYHGIIL